MSTLCVTRSATIQATHAVVLAQVGDLREWPGWWPWARELTGLRRAYGGPERAVGSFMHWSGDPGAGEGRLEITQHSPLRITADLAFDTPYRATNTTSFDLSPRDGATEVAWTMSGDRNPMTAIVGHLFLDRELVGHLDRGLDQLRSVCEA